MPQCAGNLPRRWQRRSRAEKGEKGEREVGVSLQIFCVSVCVFGNKWYPRWKNVTLCPVFCETLFKLQEKTKTKGEEKWLINGFSEIASEADHMCYILKNELEYRGFMGKFAYVMQF